MMNIELTKEELIYAFDCISDRVNNTTIRLHDTVDYISKALDTFVDLQDRIDRDLTDMEQGTDLLGQLIECLTDTEEYEKYRELLIEKQKQNKERRHSFEKARQALDDSEDDT